ncbi:MAG: hypothetical protein RRY13_03680 [Akkermansia sp.]
MGVDDWGLLEIRNAQGNVVAKVDLQLDSQAAGDQGGCKYHSSTGGAQLPSGSYTWSVNQTNINYDPPSGNVSVCNYKIDVVPTEAGGKKKPDPCDCEGDTCNGDGGDDPPSRSMRRSSQAGNVPAGYSSAGSSVTSEITESLMYWSCNFGSFRGLGSLPAGRIELRAKDSVSGLQNTSALAFNHPLSSYLAVPAGSIVAGTPFAPTYDTAGNQTKVKTSTGIWTLVYDANNRPISFTSEDGQRLCVRFTGNSRQ